MPIKRQIRIESMRMKFLYNTGRESDAPSKFPFGGASKGFTSKLPYFFRSGIKNGQVVGRHSCILFIKKSTKTPRILPTWLTMNLLFTAPHHHPCSQNRCKYCTILRYQSTPFLENSSSSPVHYGFIRQFVAVLSPIR